MSVARRLLRYLGGVVIGAAAWFSLGTLAITPDGVIAGLLPPRWLLAMFIVAGPVAVVWLPRIPLTIVFLPG